MSDRIAKAVQVGEVLLGDGGSLVVDRLVELIDILLSTGDGRIELSERGGWAEQRPWCPARLGRCARLEQ